MDVAMDTHVCIFDNNIIISAELEPAEILRSLMTTTKYLRMCYVIV